MLNPVTVADCLFFFKTKLNTDPATPHIIP